MREAITEAGDGSSQGVELGASAFHSGGVGVVLVKRERVPVEVAVEMAEEVPEEVAVEMADAPERCVELDPA